MTAERAKAINEWLGTHCQKCVNNFDRGTDFVNCQVECEIQKDIGVACIHYEEATDIKPYKGLVKAHKIIADLPPVTPQPKTGHWIRVDENKLRCSECEVTHFIAQYPSGKIGWCPNCGAKMIEPQESEV